MEKLNEELSRPLCTAQTDVHYYLRSVVQYEGALQEKRGVLLSLLADIDERQRRVRGAKMDEFEANMQTACTEAAELTKRCEKRLQQLSGDTERAASIAAAEAEAREFSFVAMMNKAEELSESLQARCESGDWLRINSEYILLNKMNSAMKRSKSRTARLHIDTLHAVWTEKLCDYARQCLDALLKKIEYPFMQLISQEANRIENSTTLTAIVECLYNVEWHFHADQPFAEWTLVKAFTEPLLEKFDFHFDSSRKTNDASHPEWYYQQVSEWIQANVPFVRVLVDPTLAAHAEEHNLPPDCALIHRELTRALLTRCAEKSRRLALEFIESDADDAVQMLAHLIDETVAMQMRMEAMLGNTTLNLLDSLCDETRVLQLWLDVERHCIMNKTEQLLSEENAWKSKYDDDVFMVPECIDAYITLLKACNERYRMLTNRVALIHYARMLIGFFDDLRTRLTQIARSLRPDEQKFMSVMNAAWFLHLQQDQWSSDPFFVRLRHECESRKNMTDAPTVERGHFDDMSKLYKHLWQKMAADLVNFIVRRRCANVLRPYTNEKWQHIPSACAQHAQADASESSVQCVAVSTSLCPLLYTTRSSLAMLSEMIAPAVRNEMLRRVGDALAQMLFEKLVEQTWFSARGASQMHYDIVEGLMPMLHSLKVLSRDALSVEWARLTESLRILSLSTGTVHLLREALVQQGNLDDICQSMIADMNVTSLTKREVLQLLGRRVEVTLRQTAAPRLYRLSHDNSYDLGID